VSVNRLRVIAAVVVAILLWGEVAHWRASHRRTGHGQSSGRREAVVVLGYKNRGGRANYLTRYRVRAGIRSLDPAATESVLVLCGGAVAGDVPEAELMERYARDELGYSGPILLDRDSRSTWENIQNAIPLIENAESIKIVSNSLHAEKGRAYLWTLRPDLADRLSRGEDYRFGEITLVKPAAAALGLRDLWTHRG
jgi:vancomycin permeability regulator SanA